MTNPELDIEKLERIHGLYEKEQERRARIAYDEALPGMRAALPVIEEGGAITNKQREKQSTYGYWADIDQKITPVLAEYGFGLSHRVTNGEGNVTVTAILSHRQGHRETTELTLPYDNTGSKNAVQSIGSSTTYGKRYTAQLLVGFVTKGDKSDDDGNGPVEFITEDQQEELKVLCGQAEIDLMKFLGHYNVASFNVIPANKFKTVKSALITRITARTAAAKRAENDDSAND